MLWRHYHSHDECPASLAVTRIPQDFTGVTAVQHQRVKAKPVLRGFNVNLTSYGSKNHNLVMNHQQKEDCTFLLINRSHPNCSKISSRFLCSALESHNVQKSVFDEAEEDLQIALNSTVRYKLILLSSKIYF